MRTDFILSAEIIVGLRLGTVQMVQVSLLRFLSV
ncbi:hypothetical protein O9992_20650 [Vibrio lentus]|nr:hypothetical protein [Vibrio lentus]